uniref:AT28012p1 n=1 Tax=Drosophila melanogaster TaxID=7227 RepID=G4LU65_DROME|nr:AT28012p1 [Drosophila melanogaster]
MDELEHLSDFEAGESGRQGAAHLLPATIPQTEQALGNHAGIVESFSYPLAMVGEGIEVLDAHLANEFRVGEIV